MVRSINEPDTPTASTVDTPTTPAPTTYINDAGETVYGDVVVPPTTEPGGDVGVAGEPKMGDANAAGPQPVTQGALADFITAGIKPN
jgi:hypothetical protein